MTDLHIEVIAAARLLARMGFDAEGASGALVRAFARLPGLAQHTDVEYWGGRRLPPPRNRRERDDRRSMVLRGGRIGC